MLDRSAAASASPSAGTPFGRIARVAVGALVAAGLAVSLASCNNPAGGWFGGGRAENGCMRPSAQTGTGQREIHMLRRAAFGGDFFAQLELARRYDAGRPEKNSEDPVESAVWYAVALANEGGYSNVWAGRPSNANQVQANFDRCRAVERRYAYDSLDRLLSRMDSGEQDKVRQRVIYVLYSQGAPGMRTLARIHDVSFGFFGEPPDNKESVFARGRQNQRGYPSAISLFPRNDVDAYLYNYLAVSDGDIGAYNLLKNFEASGGDRARFGAFVEAKARRWTPPFEFYPPDAPRSGVVHSDESDTNDEAAAAALERLDELPFIHIAEALAYVRRPTIPTRKEKELDPVAVQAFQSMIGRTPTGRMTPIEKVRVVQLAAINGSPRAQLVLAVMYSEGVGVRRDYARAFYWFNEAAKQGSAEAHYAVSVFFSTGLDGVVEQDKAQAVVHQIDAALSGFGPSTDRMSELLCQVSASKRSDCERIYR